MAVYRIFGEHLISEGEFAVKGAEVTRLVAAGSGAQPSITLDNGGVLSFAAVDVGQGDAVAFPAVAYGKPMTIDIRSVYTGNVGSKSLFDGTGDIAVVSGVKDWSSVKASARGLNFVASKTGRHALLAGPDALSDGTRLVAYQKAVATAQVVASFEIVAAPPDPVLLTKLGGAFTAAAGVPLFLPYAGALLAAGQLVPLAGSLIDAIGARSPGWHQSAELSFDLPGPNPKRRPAIIAAVAEPGRFTGIQRAFLEPDGSKLASDLADPKMALGRPLHGAVQLYRPGVVLGLAEGFETAMSAAFLLGIPVWAALGGERLHQINIPGVVQRLILLPDNDRAGRIAAARAEAAYVERPFELGLEWPWFGLNDWNDVLRRSDLWGGKGVMERMRLAA